MRKKLFIPLLTAATMALTAGATSLTVTMNNRSTTLAMTDMAGNPVNVGTPTDLVYQFDIAPGEYIISGIDINGNVNGTVNYVVEDKDAQSITIETHWVYANNKKEDSSYWEHGKDYTANVRYLQAYRKYDVHATIGYSELDYAFGLLSVTNNYDIYVDLTPSAEHFAEGYRPTTISRTSSFGGSGLLYTAIPMSYLVDVKIPSDAYAEFGIKEAHFKDFTKITPDSETTDGTTKTVSCRLVNGDYNLRVWHPGGLTHACIFKVNNANQTIEFSPEEFATMSPKQVNHDVKSNNGYETGDIFLNINPQGYLSLNQGDQYNLHAMRTWELTNGVTSNYFFEPDFHFTITDLNGNPSNSVIEIAGDESTSAWRTLKAVGKGTAIVTVTYDAMSVTYNGKDRPFTGGQYWGAIWPENTGTFVVTVDQPTPSVTTNMTVNSQYNIQEGKNCDKQAGAMVDSEHDVFYYLESEDGYIFTFTPEGVAQVMIAYPTIGENTATYTGFSTDGVTANTDGSYSLLLKYGRNIIQMTDLQGNATYQILNAKPCNYTLTNLTRNGSQDFHPGDEIEIQFRGLFHPAGKLAGIYNQSCYMVYNGVPNGTSLYQGSGQYTFASAESAQCIKMAIPNNLDVAETPVLALSEGMLQIKGYGDAIGNHRSLDPEVGRQPNMSAGVREAYFGDIPDINIPLVAAKEFTIVININTDDAKIILTKNGNAVTPDQAGRYPGSVGKFSLTVDKRGYELYTCEFEIESEPDEDYVLDVNLKEVIGSWDGHSVSEPTVVDGIYQISNAYELAWFSREVNSGNVSIDATITADIDLNNMEWTPIGQSKNYKGHFNGQGHIIKGLFINSPEKNSAALIGRYNGQIIEGISVYGYVNGSYDCAGVVGKLVKGTVRECRNYAEIKAQSTSAAGIAGTFAKGVIENCANYGNVTSLSLNAGGIAGSFEYELVTIKDCANYGDISAESVVAGIGPENFAYYTLSSSFNAGKITGSEYFGSCGLDPWDAAGDFTNLFGLEDEANNWHDGETDIDGTEIVSVSRMASGEIAYRLGEAFGQTIGEDAHPVLHGAKVFKVSYTVVTEADGAETLDESADDNTAGNDDESTATAALYTNGSLPETLDGYKAQWFKDAALSIPATSVAEDATLYVKLGDKSAINGLEADADCTDARWYNLQGVEIAAPAKGTRGIFIRVVNGRGTKVVL